MTGTEIERWIETRQRPDGRSMNPTYATAMAGVDRATLYRWVAVGEMEIRSTRTLRDFVEWMRNYDRANPRRRTKGAPHTPDALRI